MQTLFDSFIGESAQPIIVCFLHIGVPPPFNGGTGVGVMASGGICTSMGVTLSSASFKFSKLDSSELDSKRSSAPASPSDALFLLPSLSSLLSFSELDSVRGGDVWGFLILGPFGGVSTRVITFSSLANLSLHWELDKVTTTAG